MLQPIHASTIAAPPAGSHRSEVVHRKPIRSPNTRYARRAHLPLTPKQLAALRGVAKGRCNKEIARELGITVASVKTTLQHVYARIGVGTRLQAALLVAKRPDLLAEG